MGRVVITPPYTPAARPRAPCGSGGDTIARALAEFDGKSPDGIRNHRHERILDFGRSL